MNLSSLSAFWHVTQWRVSKRLTAAECVARVNATWADASTYGENTWEPREEIIHRKVIALWEMEKYGVRLGMMGGVPRGLTVTQGAMPIAIVGIGAGCVAKLGFSAEGFKACMVEDPIILWFWEGVGHMLALQYHPVVAFMLGMPRVKQKQFCGDDTPWADQFGREASERITYGFQRMQYLCGQKRYAASPGGAFAAAMVNHRNWEYPTAPISPGQIAAQNFVNLIWPGSVATDA